MGLKDFLKTIAPETEVLRAIRAAATKNKTSRMTNSEINREISAHRRERKQKNGSKRRS